MKVLKTILSSAALCFILGGAAWAKPWVVAHRGGTELGPENAMQTFERALALKVDGIELDIHQSVDGQLFVIHDSTLDRTYGRPGKVEEMTGAELEKVGLPRLESVLSLVGRRAHLVIEIKEDTPKLEEHLIESLQSAHLTDYVVVISFKESCLKRLSKLQPDLATGYLFGKESRSPAQLKQELGVKYLGPHYSQVSQDWLRQAHDQGLKVNPWTVDAEPVMRELERWGADAVTTNKPTLLQRVLSDRPPGADSN